MGYLLAIDLGTTSCKSALFSEEGELAYITIRRYVIERVRQGWAEQNPEEWWRALLFSVRDLMKRSYVKPDQILAIAVSSMEEGIVPLDKNGQVLYNCMLWMDQRSLDESRWIRDNIGDELLISITGTSTSFLGSAPRILWIRNNLPKIFEKISTFLQPKDFINFRLTGQLTTDHSIAGHTQLFDIKRRIWSSKIFDQLKLSPNLMPEVYPSSKVVGELLGEVAESLGLVKSTPVIAGCGDIEAAAIGSGIIDESRLYESNGSSSILGVYLYEPIAHRDIPIFCHPDGRGWIAECNSSYTGLILDWLQKILYNSSSDIQAKFRGQFYDKIESKADKIGPGSDGLFFIPHMTPLFIPGLSEKIRGTFFGLNLELSIGHIVRSIFEGSAFSLRTVLELVEESLHKLSDEIVVSGGVSKSRVWRRIRADITGKKFLSPKIVESTVFGDAILAAVGIGVYKSLDVAKNLVKIVDVDEPELSLNSLYDRLYSKYRYLDQNIRRTCQTLY